MKGTRIYSAMRALANDQTNVKDSIKSQNYKASFGCNKNPSHKSYWCGGDEDG